MPELTVREPFAHVRVIDMAGDVTADSEDVVMEAYSRASTSGVRVILLNYAALDYMNSGGIGLLVTLLIRAQRNGQRMLGCDLSDHYRQIFELTRLDEAIAIHDSEPEALGAAAAL
jgi:anti-sigma B factor antagonist